MSTIPSLKTLAARAITSQHPIFKRVGNIAWAIEYTHENATAIDVWMDHCRNDPIIIYNNAIINDVIQQGILNFRIVNTIAKRNISSESVMTVNFLHSSMYRIECNITRRYKKCSAAPSKYEFTIFWHRMLNIYVVEGRVFSLSGAKKHKSFSPEWLPNNQFAARPMLVTPQQWEVSINKCNGMSDLMYI